MPLEKTGQHRLPTRIDDPGSGPRQRRDLCRTTHSEDTPTRNGNSLCAGAVRVHGQDASMGQDQIGGGHVGHIPRIPAAVLPPSWARKDHRNSGITYFNLMAKCLRTGSSIVQVPLKDGSTTKASPGISVTGSPPSGVMVMRPSIR